MSTWVILLAAGSGTRFGGRKQDELVGGKPLWRWSYDALMAAGPEGIVIVGDGLDTDIPTVTGGPRRQDSVAAGLAAIPESCQYVLVHDAARPAVSTELVTSVRERLKLGDVDGVIPALPVTDTIKRLEAGLVVETLDRSSLVTVQTPQAFRADALRQAHAQIREDVTDDASMLEKAGMSVSTVAGDERNLKVTYPNDLDRLDPTS